ncbi:MAG: CoA-transferase, partial [Verrucomicrobiota bacterium]
MNLITKAYLLQHLIRWRLTWDKRNTRYRFTVPGNPRFMSARDAVKLIQDGDVIATSGIAGNQRMSAMIWAVRELFDETGHPRNLTVFNTSGQGARGKVPGSIEDLGVEGLLTRLITGHVETVKAQLRLAAAGKMEIQCLPQGEVAFLMEAQGRGEDSILTRTGIGTFVDPRVGPGSHIFDPKAEQLITVEGEQLRYRAPKIRVAMFGAPAADREGNLYLDNATIIGETLDIVRAARKNGGRVIANVGCIVEKGAGKVVIPASDKNLVFARPQVLSAARVKSTGRNFNLAPFNGRPTDAFTSRCGWRRSCWRRPSPTPSCRPSVPRTSMTAGPPWRWTRSCWPGPNTPPRKPNPSDSDKNLVFARPQVLSAARVRHPILQAQGMSPLEHRSP